jgi:hypothetical protein
MGNFWEWAQRPAELRRLREGVPRAACSSGGMLSEFLVRPHPPVLRTSTALRSVATGERARLVPSPGGRGGRSCDRAGARRGLGPGLAWLPSPGEKGWG